MLAPRWMGIVPIPLAVTAHSLAGPASFSAVHWLEDTLLDTLATVIAVVGLMMLTVLNKWHYGTGSYSRGLIASGSHPTALLVR